MPQSRSLANLNSGKGATRSKGASSRRSTAEHLFQHPPLPSSRSGVACSRGSLGPEGIAQSLISPERSELSWRLLEETKRSFIEDQKREFME